MALSLGGIGGGAGAAAAVTVTSSGGSLSTYAHNSAAIFAQSVGGDGGSGGSAASTSGNGGSVSTAMGLGGSGAGGGGGGAVLVCGTVSGTDCGSGLGGTGIQTFGELSYGVFAQSVGGGGGAGGAVSTAASGGSDDPPAADNTAASTSSGTSASASSGVALSAGLGGSGGGGGAGNAVTVSVATGVSTHGDQATAIVAQSVGGGGGVGGASNTNANSGAYAVGFSLGGSGGTGGKGGAVAVTTAKAGALATSGDLAFGILAQSVGGGGGVAGSASSTSADGGNASVAMALGGSAGSGQDGGSVTVAHNGTLSTSGEGASGILAQSIGGGGGGNGGASTSTSQSSGANTVGLALGGSAATASAGGAVNVCGAVGTGNACTAALSGAGIVTAGANSAGIFAQSVGGGGVGGAVTVNSGVLVQTLGAQSSAIFAQSVGGGGGAGGSSAGKADGGAFVATLTVGGAGGTGGKGGAVAVTNASSGAINTQGELSYGVFAQSGGGGGGVAGASSAMASGSGTASATLTIGGSAGNAQDGGSVTVANSGSITTGGAGANAVLAQSVGGGGGVGGSAVHFEGPTNELNNSGSLSTLDGINGLAVHTVAGDTQLNNSGTVQGNLALAADGNNRVRNLGTGTLLAGNSLDLGGSGLPQNDGVLKSGGAAGSTTHINGSLQQSASGSIELRLDHAKARVDSFVVSGTAQLQGSLRPTLVNSGLIVPGTVTLGSVLRSGGGLDISGLSIANTAIMRFEPRNEDGAISLSSTADFSPRGLSADGRRFGQLLGEVNRQGLPTFQALTARLVEMPTVASLRQAYWHVSGAGVSSVALVGDQMSTAFTKLLLDRFGTANHLLAAPAVTGQVSGGGQNERAWGQAYGDSSRVSPDASAEGAELTTRSHGVAAGFERRLAADTVLGLALGSHNARFGLADGLDGRSEAVQFGLYGSKQFGAAYASAALSVGWHRMKTSRTLELVDASYTADFRAHGSGLRLEGGHRWAAGSAGITPYAALQVQNFVTPGYAEHPGDTVLPHLALNVERRSATTLRSELGAAVETTVALAGDDVLALRTRAAWVHNHASHADLRASFQTALDSHFNVAGTAPVPDLALLSAWAEWRLAGGLSLGARLEGEISNRSHAYTGTATVRYRW